MMEGGGNFKSRLKSQWRVLRANEIHSVKIVEWRGSTNDRQLNHHENYCTVTGYCMMQYVMFTVLPVYLIKMGKIVYIHHIAVTRT